MLYVVSSYVDNTYDYIVISSLAVSIPSNTEMTIMGIFLHVFAYNTRMAHSQRMHSLYVLPT